jgi:serine/threonine protein kinase
MRYNLSAPTLMSCCLNLSFNNLQLMVENLAIFKEPNSRFRIIEPLKINDKRAVYLVTDFDTQPKVLKFLLKISTTDEQLWIYNFYKDLTHPNFCKIYSIESIDRFYMVVQEYIDGQTLGRYFESNPSKCGAYCTLFELIFALDYIHSRSIVHGDIKPENIIVRKGCNVPIIIDYDMGKNLLMCNVNQTQITKSTNSPNSLIRTTIRPFGTNLYMSPEMSNDLVYDIKTDIWSLGITLYVCIIPGIQNLRISDSTLNSNNAESTSDNKNRSFARASSDQSSQISPNRLSRDVYLIKCMLIQLIRQSIVRVQFEQNRYTERIRQAILQHYRCDAGQRLQKTPFSEHSV